MRFPRLRLWSLTSVLIGAVALVLAVGVGRSMLDSLLTRMWESAPVHADRSSFATGVASEVARDQIVLVWRTEDGERRRVLAEQEAYSAFVRRAFAKLESSREMARERAAEAVAARLGPIEEAAHGRIEHYADWYFAWPTTYRLLYEAGKSGLRHAFAPRLIGLDEAVAADVGAYLRRHYKEQVLEPEVTDAELRHAFAGAYAVVHDHYLDALAMLEDDFQVFVAEQTRHPTLRSSEVAAAVEIDWHSQLRKLKAASHEKGGIGALASAGGIAALAAAGGRTAPLAFASAGATPGKQGIARLWTRLAGPAASKASGAALGAGGTSAVGAALAGPLGVAVGAGAGLLLDYTVNEGVELIDRERFVSEVDTAVAATFNEWRGAMTASLEDALDVWFDDTVQLLGQFKRGA